MIRTEIWKQGSSPSLDVLFEQLRIQQFSDTTHPLHSNYNLFNFQEALVLSITFDNDIPVCCSSILNRNCWPKNTYRILNRFWKVKSERFILLNTGNKMLRISHAIKSQLEFCQNNLDAELIFISRYENNWQKFMLDCIKNNTNYVWNKDVNYRYQTCDNAEDDTCWQSIIYYGNTEILKNWTRK